MRNSILNYKKLSHWDYFLRIFFMGMLCHVLAITMAEAEHDVSGPGWLVEGDVDSVTCDTAYAYHDNNLSSIDDSGRSAEDIEITALARALQYDPKLIYDYVYNHIDYVPYFGALKGALLTLLSGSGNDFDQASLMVALLRASFAATGSGDTAVFVSGTMYLPTSKIANWLIGSDSYLQARTNLANGGIPVTYGSDSQVSAVSRVWVKANIDGIDYYFDPALKDYEYTDPVIDLAGATEYNSEDLFAAVGAGATIGPDFVQNYNEGELDKKLTEYSSNLIDTIRSRYPNKEVSDIMGGRRIVESKLTSLPTLILYPIDDTIDWTEIPSGYIATVRIQYQGIDHTFSIPDMASKRLTLTYTGSNFIPELRLEGNLVASGHGTSQGTTYDLILSIDHPYAAREGTYSDQTATYRCKSGATYAFFSGFGNTNNKVIEKRQKMLNQNISAGHDNSSEEVLGESLNVMGLTWVKEVANTSHLLDKITNSSTVIHHGIGMMAQESGYFVDAKNMFISITSRSNDFDWKKSFFVSVMMLSALEHGVLEQMMGSAFPGISTIKIFHLANAGGKKIFWVDKDNFDTVSPQLVNYTANDISTFQSSLNPGRFLILPQDGQLGIGQWKGKGYIDKADKGNGIYIGMKIGGGYNGGYSAEKGEISTKKITFLGRIKNFFVKILSLIKPTTSKDPVDLYSGALYYNHTDLTLGSAAPNGLAFVRSYNSHRKGQKSLGHGWSHNYDISLVKHSDEDAGLGLRQPVDMAAVITSLFVSLDVMEKENNAKGWVLSSLISKWAVDQLIDNAVAVKMGGKVLSFTKLPDPHKNLYAPPPGITSRLIENDDGTFHLQERNGTRLDFDGRNLLTQIADIDGNQMTLTYDADDQLTTVRDSVGRSLTLEYTDGKITTVTDSEGRSVSYGYCEFDNLMRYTDTAGKTWGFEYDGQHQMTKLTNPLGIITAINTYDALGRVDTQNTPRQGGNGGLYKFYFSGYRNIEEDPYERQMIYYFDHKGRNVALENEQGIAGTKTYDGQNHLIEVTDARNNTSKFAYDAHHNLIETENALGHKITRTYDEHHRLKTMTDALENTTQLAYDGKHHLTQITDPLFNTTELTYYPDGTLKTMTDGRGAITTVTYDRYKNPITTQTGAHLAAQTTFDRIGRMLDLTDQEGSTTEFAYDNRGLLLERTDPLGNIASYAHDDAGRMVTRVDRYGDRIIYHYTLSDMIEEITYPDGSGVDYTYDLHDNLLSMQDKIGTSRYTYDDLYQLASFTNPFHQTISHEYDEAGNVTKIIYPDEKAVTYTYDALNRMKTVTNWLNQTVFYEYDAAGRLTGSANFNGTIKKFGYDNANRLISLINKGSSSGTIISSYTYTLDENGNRTQINQKEPLTGMLPSGSTSYEYNPNKNRLLSLNGGGTTFRYDDEGQLAGKDNATFLFNAGHHLMQVTGSKTSKYRYDGEGNRLEAVQSGNVTRYVYDTGGNLLAETDGENNITRYYIHGQDGLLAMVTPGGQTYTYHYNGIGSTTAITDQAQNIVNMYAYTPFGQLIDERETIEQPFKYVGADGVMTESNGFYYMRARYYDPQIGRFISEDPIGFDGGQVNLMAYVGNNPINFIDPLGLSAEARAGSSGSSASNIGRSTDVTKGRPTGILEVAVDHIKAAVRNIFGLKTLAALVLPEPVRKGLSAVSALVGGGRFVLDARRTYIENKGLPHVPREVRGIIMPAQLGPQI